MKFSPILCHLNARRWLPAAAAVLAISGAAGCASPGPPQPPSLKLPEMVKDLTAQRVGDVVRLHWTTPSTTTDNIDIKGPMTADVCRMAVSSAPPPYVCIP